MEKKRSSVDIRRLSGLSLLAALVAVLAIVGNSIKIPLGPVTVPITLTLCPIIVGGAVYGPAAGAMLGFVFGLVTFITGMIGMDGGFVYMLFSQNPVALIVMCFGKAIACGWCGAMAYRVFGGKSPAAGTIASGIVTPVVNTGIFIILMLLCYFNILSGGAADSGKLIGNYIITGFVGINFLVELVLNMLLASGITTVIRYGQKRNRREMA